MAPLPFTCGAREDRDPCLLVRASLGCAGGCFRGIHQRALLPHFRSPGTQRLLLLRAPGLPQVWDSLSQRGHLGQCRLQG